jgi:hypothetical protein
MAITSRAFARVEVIGMNVLIFYCLEGAQVPLVMVDAT